MTSYFWGLMDLPSLVDLVVSAAVAVLCRMLLSSVAMSRNLLFVLLMTC